VLTATAWVLQPSLHFQRLWGQLTPQYDEFEPYDGKVIALTVNGQPILNEPLPEDPTFYVPFWHGVARFEVVATAPGRASQRLSAIARIANPVQEALLVAQDDLDLIVRVRLRTSDLRLRTPTIAVANAFPPPPGDSEGAIAPDTVRIQGGMSARTIFASASSNGGRHRWAVPLSPALGWSLFLPFSFPLGEGYRWLSAIWMAALFAPVAFWMALRVMRDPRPTHAVRRTVAIGIGVTIIGLVVVPVVFDLAVVHWSEWAGVLSGASGAVVAAYFIARSLRGRVSG
jgi:hypothetical protein